MSTMPRRAPDEASAPILRKPMAKATRVTLFEREIRERLSDPAIELLLGAAQVLSEGKVARIPGGGEAFYGTTMLTMNLATVGEAFRERCDEAAARRVAALMTGDARIARRARATAEREASHLAGRAVKAAASDVRVRAQGTTVFVDVDLEGQLFARPA
jgi:hypothetical protein